MSEKKIPMYAGIVWYKEDQYDELRKLFKDGDDLPPTFSAWLARAGQDIEDAGRKGLTVKKVIVDLVEFPAWCRATGHDVDNKGRTAYIGEIIARELGLSKR